MSGKTLKAKEFERIERLRRRAAYVNKRIESHQASEGALNYDKSEVSALEWAIPILELYMYRKLKIELGAETWEAVKAQVPKHILKELE